ncbi:MAG: hypothetical protein DRQ63_11085 [Gammaproteobacteria bacterium]|nr:MAG: hypothetical protein DRQ63_11085 [Gammaproteobacteria bacterium]
MMLSSVEAILIDVCAITIIPWCGTKSHRILSHGSGKRCQVYFSTQQINLTPFPDTFSDPPDGKGLLGLFDQVILKIT